MHKACVAALALLLSLPVAAREFEGVKAPDTEVVNGTQLQLNGMGLRKKAFFKVYVAALYLEKKSKDSAEVIQSDQVKKVAMIMLRDLGRGKIVDAVREGFEKNAGPDLPKLRERLEKFVNVIPDLKEGDQLSIVYTPGKGTSIVAVGGGKAQEHITVQGKDFADALFAVWLGRSPVSDDLKNGMLGR